ASVPNWPPASLEPRVGSFHKRQAEYDLLRGLQAGNLAIKGKTFPFRDRQCRAADVKPLLEQVNQELEAEIAGLQQLDREVFQVHWSLARQLDQVKGEDHGRETELLERYRFHVMLQGLLQGMFGEQARLHSILDFIAKHPQMTEGDFAAVTKALREIHHSLTTNLEDATKFSVPALANVPAGASLRS